MQAFLKGGTSSFASKPSKENASSSSGSQTKKKLTPWVEKYRPRSVDDVAHQDEVVAVLKKSLHGGDLPNLLFYGPPGTGKTSTILAIARDLFGDMFRERILELNASDERGINVIRAKVKSFSQLTASGTRPDGRACPPFRIIILDEADSMTSAAQAALRRTMEKGSKTTRFCLICNYVTRIIEPITSRCAKFRFKPIIEAVLKERLEAICKAEVVSCEEKALREIIKISEGDMRKAITLLQSLARLRGSEEIVLSDTVDISGVVPEDVIDNLIRVCHSDSYDKLDNTIQELMAEGHSAVQLLLQLHDKFVEVDELGDNQKSVIFEKIAVVDKCLMDGADEYLQMMALCTVIMQQICHADK